MPLELNEYQNIAASTAIYKDAIVYPALGLAGEAGEVAEKIKKLIRDKGGISNLPNLAEEDRDAVAALSRDLGYKLEDVARINIGKLAKRKEEGKLQGSGDNR
jgi:NTP pyrophosphatase (non-canonical NTP hydrolase)